MSKRDPSLRAESERPYGSDPTGSRTALWFWGGLYGIWFLLLLWMAVYHTGQ